MTRFEDIKIHDLVYIDNAEWGANGWFCVTGTWGEFFDAEELGCWRSSTYVIYKEDVGEVVKAHIRMSAVPGAIEALEQIAQSEVCVKETLVDGGKASFVFRPENNDFGYEAVRVASAALRAVRGEESV
jgi:hypothetical protein